MPDFWTHTHGGNQILENIHQLTYKNLFNYACQGPDFLFYLNFSPFKGKRIGKALGSQIHKESAQEFLQELFISARGDTNTIIQEYFYGALCHYILDVYMHPLINKYSNENYSHKDVEMAMDLIINKYLEKPLPNDDNPRNYLDFQTSLSDVEAWYFEAVNTIHGQRIVDPWITMAQKDFMDFHILFSDMNPLKAIFLKIIHNVIPVKSYIYPRTIDKALFTDNRIKEIIQTYDQAVAMGKTVIKKAQYGFNHPTEPISLFENLDKLDYNGIPY